MIEIELNPLLNWEQLAQQYHSKARIQIGNFLTESSIERILQCLQKEISWHLAYYDGKARLLSHEDLRKKTPEEVRNLQAHLAKVASSSAFHYIYDCYPLIRAYKEKWEPDLYLNRWLEFINGEVFLKVMRKLTGHADITRADSQATRYSQNQYLTRHNDDVPAEVRRAAYVLNITKNWDPNWGGYLQFFNKGKNLDDGFIPEFNTLNVFSVPQDHSVGCISQFAQRYRYTMVGWLRGPEELEF